MPPPVLLMLAVTPFLLESFFDRADFFETLFWAKSCCRRRFSAIARIRSRRSSYLANYSSVRGKSVRVALGEVAINEGSSLAPSKPVRRI